MGLFGGSKSSSARSEAFGQASGTSIFNSFVNGGVGDFAPSNTVSIATKLIDFDVTKKGHVVGALVVIFVAVIGYKRIK